MVKIAICGAGIAGLSTYLLLQKHLNDSTSQPSAHEITIYEAYDVGKPSSKNSDGASSTDESTPTAQTIGSGIGISKNGLNVLSRMEREDRESGDSSTGLDSGLIKEMARRGHPIERWEISTARGWTIVDVNLVPRHLRNPSSQSSGKGSSSPSVTDRKPYMYHSVMIARKACWEILRDRVLEQWPDAVVKKRVVDVSIGDAATLSVIKFEDGTEESVDLVIGADGLRSVVRKAMFETNNAESHADNGHAGRPQSDHGWAQAVLRWLGLSSTSKENTKNASKPTGPDYITPHYEGLVGVGGLVPSSLLESSGHKPGTMSIVFGPNGFFGYGYLTSSDPKRSDVPDTKADAGQGGGGGLLIPTTSSPGPVAGWWSTFSSKTPYPYTTETSGPNQPNKPSTFDKPLATTALLARHAKWKNPTISAIVNYVEACSDAPSSPSPATAPSPSTPPTTPPPGCALEASYPTWTTPELPAWTARGRVALVGDAAHALQPSSGQGACQALEDGEALALFLRHNLLRGRPPRSLPLADRNEATAVALATALKHYEALRMPRVHAIYERSQRMSRMKGDMGVVLEWTMYLMIYVMTWFRDSYNDVLFEYDLPAEVEKVLRDAEKQ